MNAWAWWLVAAAGLGIPLLITALPEFGMLSAGAVAASAAAALGAGGVLQVLVFAVVSVALVSVVRGIALRHRTTRPELRTGIEALKGRPALVLERVDGQGGRVKIGGEVWSARSLDTDRAYDVGQQVDVVDIEGATAVVL